MTVQVNLKLSDKYFDFVKKSSEEEGYMSIQEYIRSLIKSKKEDDISLEERKFIKTVFENSLNKGLLKTEEGLMRALNE